MARGTKPKKSPTPKKIKMGNDHVEVAHQAEIDDNVERNQDLRDEDFVIDIASNGDDDDEEEQSTSSGRRRERSSKEQDAIVKKRVRRKSLSPLRNLIEDEMTNTNFQPTGATPFLSFQARNWNPQYLYRLPCDIAIGAIRRNGNEGVGRVQIGHILGMDTSTKAGNRRVSQFIQTACAEHPKQIGQFQKMEGKIRSIRYYWKAEDKFGDLYERFEEAAGVPCPFKMGQVIKFTTHKLSTLRVSDVTLKRLIMLVEISNKQMVVVTINKIMKMISDAEREQGYKYMIDKKSLMKCMIALEKEKLLNVFDTTVRTDSIDNKVQIMCHRDISSVDSTEVHTAIQQTLDEYNREGRVFPHGQLRFSRSKSAELAKAKVKEEDELTMISENLDDGPICITERFQLFRLQISRNAVMRQNKIKDEEPEKEEQVEAEETVEDTDDTTIRDEDSICDVTVKVEEEPFKLSMKSSYSAGDEMKGVLFGKVKGRQSTHYNAAGTFGYQAKAVRCMALHEVVWQMVYAHPEGTQPDLYQRFPPGKPHSQWNSEPHVFVDEESQFRFIPPLSPFKDCQRGWFMLQDLMSCIPLSTLVLIAYVNRKIDKDSMFSYLVDPIRRHTVIGDLEPQLRDHIMKDKKVFKQVEHLLLTMAAMGLFAIAQNPDPKRFATCNSSVFYCSKKALLYDTSTSQRGYAVVTPPITQYKQYIHEFNSQEDLDFYWQHLRAIAYSTPLTYRMDLVNEAHNPNRHKKFSLGLFDKNQVMRSWYEPLDLIIPLTPHEGCAGFDSALFFHLKRHWDLNPLPSACVAWFLTQFRRSSDALRNRVEEKVEVLQKGWNSYVKSLMPSDMELTKKKQISSRIGTSSMFSFARSTLSIESKASRPPSKLDILRKKRPLDSVDKISQQNRVHVRCRFTSKERDMLILVRAVGFFLNPVYRFWLDPTVLRDIMHEFVPESRSKTVQSLMAAGVREMVRPQRLAYLQRIVRNLSSFGKMRQLRSQLASSPLIISEDKSKFFINAFRVAKKMLFTDNNQLPHVSSTDAAFRKFMKTNGVVAATTVSSANPIPMRSRTPTSLAHIHHCAAVNLLFSILIHSKDEGFSESILEQISPTIIHNALQVLRTDGLVSRTRTIDQSHTLTKNQATLSFYYRHFFSHRFHPDLVEQTSLIFARLQQESCDPPAFVTLEGDYPALVIVAAYAFSSTEEAFDVDLTVDEDILGAFASFEVPNSIKQIRYLEATNLHLEKIHAFYVAREPIEDNFPTAEDLIKIIDRSHPATPVEQFEVWLQTESEENRKMSRIVYDAIGKTEAFGATFNEILETIETEADCLREAISRLVNGHQVFEVGVDCLRYICSRFSAAWCVNIEGRLCCPRPWTMPSGGICISTIRWMAESVVMNIVAKPGVQVKDLCFQFGFALQSSAVEDLITLLEAAGCIKVVEKEFASLNFSSPFERNRKKVTVRFLEPTVDCVIRFSKIFGGHQLLSSMCGGGRAEAEEVPVDCLRNVGKAVKAVKEALEQAEALSTQPKAEVA